MNEIITKPKCQMCRCYFTPTLKTDGNLYRTCDNCRDIQKNKHKKCIDIDDNGNKCKTIPTYNYEDKTKAKYCNKHKLDGMIDIINKKCTHVDENGNKCKTRPIYNYEDKTKAEYCNQHKLDGMINIKDKTCIHIDENGNKCKTQPIYNYEDKNKAEYCNQHKLDGMINIKSKNCIHIDENGNKCKTQPTYNYEGKTKAEYCNQHKLDGMIDILNRFKNCIHVDDDGNKCKTQPIYNYEDKTKAEYCNQHKLDGMIDIRHKNCIHINKNGNKCETHPSRNYEDQTKAEYCNKHKLDGMIDILNKKCIHIDENGNKCKKIPVYNYEDKTKAEYCNQHKLDGMMNIKHKICNEPLCDKCVAIDGKCTRCFYFYNPNDNRVKRVKIKENEVINFIKQEFDGLDLIIDKGLIGEKLCINNRPDILINLNKHSIIIECDEDQHKYYEKDCDLSREHKMHEALDRNVIFIRFNPDSYKDHNKKKVMGCFTMDKVLGLTTIRKNQIERWNNRLSVLKKVILQSMDKTTDTPIEKIYLYYDGYNDIE